MRSNPGGIRTLHGGQAKSAVQMGLYGGGSSRTGLSNRNPAAAPVQGAETFNMVADYCGHGSGNRYINAPFSLRSYALAPLSMTGPP